MTFPTSDNADQLKHLAASIRKEADAEKTHQWFNQNDKFHFNLNNTTSSPFTTPMLEADLPRVEADVKEAETEGLKAAAEKDFNTTIFLAEQQKEKHEFSKEAKAFRKEHHGFIENAVKHFNTAYDMAGLASAKALFDEAATIKDKVFTSAEGYCLFHKCYLAKENGLSLGVGSPTDKAATVAKIIDTDIKQHGEDQNPQNAVAALKRINDRITEFKTKLGQTFEPLTLQKLDNRPAAELEKLANWLDKKSADYKTPEELKAAGMAKLQKYDKEFGRAPDPVLAEKLKEAQKAVNAIMASGSMGFINSAALQTISTALNPTNVPQQKPEQAKLDSNTSIAPAQLVKMNAVSSPELAPAQ